MSEEIILAHTRANGSKLKEAMASYMNIDSYIKDDILANPSLFQNVKVIFSTWNMPKMTEKEIKSFLPSLKVIFYAAGSTKYFAESFLNSGVAIYDASEANGIPVAEYVTGQILLANKGYYQTARMYKRALLGRQISQIRQFSYKRPGNYKSKVGIVGCGIIGSKVLEYLSKFELELFFCDPKLEKDAFTRYNAHKTEMSWIFSNCDVISIHLPNIEQLKDVIDYKLLSLLKDTATFINTGRGAQVNENDLIRVMNEKPMACALLDVTKAENGLHRPLLSRIFRQNNIFITPHIAGSTGDEYLRMVDYIISLHKAYSSNTLTKTPITKESLKQHT